MGKSYFLKIPLPSHLLVNFFETFLAKFSSFHIFSSSLDFHLYKVDENYSTDINITCPHRDQQYCLNICSGPESSNASSILPGTSWQVTIPGSPLTCSVSWGKFMYKITFESGDPNYEEGSTTSSYPGLKVTIYSRTPSSQSVQILTYPQWLGLNLYFNILGIQINLG
jgi:hypothetical protein